MILILTSKEDDAGDLIAYRALEKPFFKFIHPVRLFFPRRNDAESAEP